MHDITYYVSNLSWTHGVPIVEELRHGWEIKLQTSM